MKTVQVSDAKSRFASRKESSRQSLVVPRTSRQDSEPLSSRSGPTNTGKLLDAALGYRQRGWAFIPVEGKKAAVETWKEYQTNPPDEPTLRRLIDDRATGIAVIL